MKRRTNSRFHFFWIAIIGLVVMSALQVLRATGDLITYDLRSEFRGDFAFLNMAIENYTTATNPFDQFTDEVSFRNEERFLNGFSIFQEDGSSNMVGNVIGMGQVKLYLDDSTSVQMNFDPRTFAFGADFASIPDLDLIKVEVAFVGPLDPRTFHLTSNGFFGIGTTEGETIQSLRFTFTPDGDEINEVQFTMDNVETAASAVPEPASLVLLMTGVLIAASFGYLSKRWRKRIPREQCAGS